MNSTSTGETGEAGNPGRPRLSASNMTWYTECNSFARRDYGTNLFPKCSVGNGLHNVLRSLEETLQGGGEIQRIYAAFEFQVLPWMSPWAG